MQLFSNNADSELNGAIDAVTTSLTLKTGEGTKFPSPTGGDFFLVTLFQKLGAAELNHEIVKCTARSGDVLTVVRAQEGTTAKAFNNADPVELRDTAGTLAGKESLLSKDASGGYAGLTLFKLNLRNAANTITSWFMTAATVARTWTMPDKDGTVAMTSDITGTNSGTNTGDQTSIVGISGTTAQFNVALTDGDFATLAGAETLTNKTLTGYTETVYALAGTVINVANGTIQTKTLSVATTFTESLADGQSVILGITAGAYSVTWPTTVWSKVGGSGTAPTLTSTGVNWVILWQTGGTLRGAFLGTT